MRRPLLVIAIAVSSAMLLAACASAAPGWTYAPPTQAPASQPAGSGAPSAPASAVASAAASDNGGSGGASGSRVDISAAGIAFEQTQVSAPAGTGFDLHFNNKDAGIPHNVEIKDANNQSVFKGDIVTGPKETDYKVPALAAGAYQFVCSVHPNMQGSLKVGG
jgi:plastocyanin